MRIVVLTGAGVSAESGLGTFRDKGGLWAKYDPMKLATPEAFADDPGLVHAFYNARRANLLGAEPNAAHHALTRLQSGLAASGGRLSIVTQNVDDLHERAGSEDVLHMHGELLKARCRACDAVSAWRTDLGTGDRCPSCNAQGSLRPHVVWFGEMPFHLSEIQTLLSQADLFVAIGTSGAVYPAAGFVHDARMHGARTREMNLEPSDNHYRFHEADYGPATTIVPRWVDSLLSANDSRRDANIARDDTPNLPPRQPGAASRRTG
ncbi:MAG: NAD-dependent deacylase [Acetobacteraceae bacterium]|nr:NAD-dependent deacylase [Acetobacteraceae bacterium]